jgi:hypothetical protein
MIAALSPALRTLVARIRLIPLSLVAIRLNLFRRRSRNLRRKMRPDKFRKFRKRGEGNKEARDP